MSRKHASPSLRAFLTSPDFSGEVRRCSASFFILILLFFCAAAILPEVRDYVANWMLGLAGEIVEDSDSISPWMLLSNNLTACALSIFYGLFPFVSLPALPMGVNAMLLGGLGAWYSAHGIPLWLFLLGLLPHGIFEIPAILLAFSSGLYLCGQITRRLTNRQTAMPLLQSLFCILRVYVVLITPLLTAAALLEAYVTPLLLSLFTL